MCSPPTMQPPCSSSRWRPPSRTVATEQGLPRAFGNRIAQTAAVAPSQCRSDTNRDQSAPGLECLLLMRPAPGGRTNFTSLPVRTKDNVYADIHLGAGGTNNSRRPATSEGAGESFHPLVAAQPGNLDYSCRERAVSAGTIQAGHSAHDGPSPWTDEPLWTRLSGVCSSITWVSPIAGAVISPALKQR